MSIFILITYFIILLYEKKKTFFFVINLQEICVLLYKYEMWWENEIAECDLQIIFVLWDFFSSSSDLLYIIIMPKDKFYGNILSLVQKLNREEFFFFFVVWLLFGLFVWEVKVDVKVVWLTIWREFYAFWEKLEFWKFWVENLDYRVRKTGGVVKTLSVNVF